jgi:enoyl-CoA hydratase/carnithine racemase
MLRVIVDGQDKDLETLIAAEKQAVASNRGSPDSQEGMRAFLEKRKPLFNKDYDNR